MRPIALSAAAFVSALTMSPVAKADWQGANWNQGVAQVQKATRLVLRLPTSYEASGSMHSDGLPAGLVFDWKMDRFVFKGAMYFERGGLSRISLSGSEPGSCKLVLDELGASYGAAPDAGSGKVFLDRRGHNRIEVSYLEVTKTSEVCAVSYYPFVENSGRL